MLGFITHPDCRLHDPGPLHPDTPGRLDAITNQMIMSGLDYLARSYDAPEASDEQLGRVHDMALIESIRALSPSDGAEWINGDTAVSPGSVEAALRAAGAGILGVDLIMAGEANPVFCAVRPPGHHATRSEAMGFCLFNNIAVAAAHALHHHGLDRVGIVDFDVHHGNGTEDIFRNEKRVLFCSSFQHPFYPFTGHEKETANLVDMPLAAGADGAAFRDAVEGHWLPALDAFKPQFLFISAGFDAHAADDSSDIRLVDDDYRWVTERLRDIAVRHAEGRILSMLEGGYEPGVLARSVIAHLRVLAG